MAKPRALCLKRVGNDKSNLIRVVRHTCGMCIAYPNTCCTHA